MPKNVIEQAFPGAHSDIGGAYADGAQGKSSELGLVVLDWMYSQAEASGVPLKPLDDKYKPSATTVKAYSDYVEARAAYELKPTESNAKVLGDSYGYLKANYIHDESKFWEKWNTRNVYPQQ